MTTVALIKHSPLPTLDDLRIDLPIETLPTVSIKSYTEKVAGVFLAFRNDFLSLQRTFWKVKYQFNILKQYNKSQTTISQRLLTKEDDALIQIEKQLLSFKDLSTKGRELAKIMLQQSQKTHNAVIKEFFEDLHLQSTLLTEHIESTVFFLNNDIKEYKHLLLFVSKKNPKAIEVNRNPSLDPVCHCNELFKSSQRIHHMILLEDFATQPLKKCLDDQKINEDSFVVFTNVTNQFLVEKSNSLLSLASSFFPLLCNSSIVTFQISLLQKLKKEKITVLKEITTSNARFSTSIMEFCVEMKRTIEKIQSLLKEIDEALPSKTEQVSFHKKFNLEVQYLLRFFQTHLRALEENNIQLDSLIQDIEKSSKQTELSQEILPLSKIVHKAAHAAHSILIHDPSKKQQETDAVESLTEEHQNTHPFASPWDRDEINRLFTFFDSDSEDSESSSSV